MISSQLLPTISLPTKLNTNHDTLIDNIFTNIYNPDMSSGNLTYQLSDHLAAFQMKTNNTYQKNITSQKGMQEISTKMCF